MSATAESATDPTTDKPPPHKRWIPLSLRLFMGLLAILSAVSLWEVDARYRQMDAIRQIRSFEGKFSTEPRGPQWLRERFVDSDWILMFDEVVGVGFREQPADAEPRPLRGLRGLKTLELRYSQITDEGLSLLSGCKTLERLDLRGTRITEVGLTHVRGMTHLEYLDLPDLNLTEPGLKRLCSLPRLKEVVFDGDCEFANAELVAIAKAHGFELFWPEFRQQTHESLKGRRKVSLVNCVVPSELRLNHATLDYDLAKHLAYWLNAKGVSVVDPDRVDAWLEKQGRSLQPWEIGAAFKNVNYVVRIDVKDWDISAVDSTGMYQGRAACIVSVIKLDESKTTGQDIFSLPMKIDFTDKIRADEASKSEATFYKRFLWHLSEEIGSNFEPVRLYRVSTEVSPSVAPGK